MPAGSGGQGSGLCEGSSGRLVLAGGCRERGHLSPKGAARGREADVSAWDVPATDPSLFLWVTHFPRGLLQDGSLGNALVSLPNPHLELMGDASVVKGEEREKPQQLLDGWAWEPREVKADEGPSPGEVKARAEGP